MEISTKSPNDLKRRIRDAAKVSNKVVKSSKPKVMSYATNIAKSFIGGTVDYTLSNMDSFRSFTEVNRDLVKDLHRTAINPKGAIGGYLNSLIDSETRDTLKKAAKYAIDDLKTGKLYDKNRDRSEFASMNEDLLSDFGGFDDFDNWGSDSLDEPKTDADKIIESDYELAEIQDERASDRTRSTIMAMGSATDAVINNQTSLHRSGMKVNTAQHAQSMLAFDNLINVNVSMIEAQSGHFAQLNSIIQESTNFLGGKFDETNSILREIKTALSPQREESKRSSKSLPFESNGTFNVKKYLGIVSKKLDDETQFSNTLSTMMGGRNLNELVQLFFNNPLDFVVMSTIGSVIPRVVKKSMDSLNQSFSAFFTNLLTKIGGKRNEDGIMGKLARIFGLDINNEVRIDLSSYNKGKFQPKTLTETLLVRIDKSVTEVMPHYLREIASALTGKKQKIFNYKDGRFVDPMEEAKRFYEKTEVLHNDMNIAKSFASNGISKASMSSSDKQKLYSDLNITLQYFAEKGKVINPFIGKPKDLSIDDDSWAIIAGIFQAMPRSMLMAASAQGTSAKIKRNRYNENINDELIESGMTQLMNGSDEGIKKYIDDMIYGNVDDKLNAAASFNKMKDVDVKGINLTNKFLFDIRDILRKGIIVYPDKGGKKSQSSSMRDSVYNARDQYISDIFEADKTPVQIDTYHKGTDENMEFRRTGNHNADDWGNKMRKSYQEDLKKHAKNEELAKEDAILKITPLSERTKGMMGKVNSVLANPFALVSTTLDSVDKALFRIIYGKESYEAALNGESNPGIIESVMKMIEGSFKKVTGWFEEKFFGEDGFFTKMQNSAKTKIFDKYVDPLKNKTKDYLIGEKGLFTPFIGSVKSEIDKMTGASTGSNLGKSISYGRSSAKVDSAFGSVDTKDMNMAERASFYLFSGINKVTSSISSTFLGDDFVDENGNIQKTDSKKLWESITQEYKGFLPKGVAAGIAGAGLWTGAGLLTGLFLPGGPLLAGILGAGASFVNHSDKLREYMFGKETRDEKGNIVESRDGLLSREVVNGFKKFAPKIAIGAGIGAMITKFGILGTSILPGGPIIGGLLGSIAGMTLASDQMRELLFGRKDDETGDSGLFSKNTRKKMVEALGIGAGGAAAGFIAGTAANSIGIFGLSLLPGGPVLAAIGGIAATLNADRIKKFFFGSDADELDEDGNKTGKKVRRDGLFGKAFNTVKDKMFEPFMKGIDERGKKVKNWFQINIVKSFSDSLSPLKKAAEESKENIKNAFNNIGKSIGDSLTGVFKDAFGDDIKTLFQDKILKPLTERVSKIVDAFGRFIGNILAFPFKALNAGLKAREAKNDRKKAAKDKALNRLARFDEAKTNIVASMGIFQSALANWGFSFNTKKRNTSTSPDGIMNESVDDNQESKGPGFFASIRESWRKSNEEAKEIRADRKDLRDKEKQSKDIIKKYEKENRAAKKAKKRGERIAKYEAKVKAKQEVREEKRSVRLAKYGAQEARAEERMSAKDDKLFESRSDNTSAATFVYSRGFKNSFHSLVKNSKAIRDEIKGQINGVGWNLAYIRNILVKRFGEAPMPDANEAKMDYNKPAGPIKRAFRRMKGWVGDKLSAAGGAVLDAKDWVTSLPLLKPLFALGRGIRKGGQIIGKGVKGGLGLLKDAKDLTVMGLSLFGQALGTGFTALTETLKTVGHGIRESITGAFKGLGEGLGAIAAGLGELGKELLGGIGMIFSGGAETLFKILLPAVARGGVKVAGKTLGLLGKGILGGMKLFGTPIWNGIKRFAGIDDNIFTQVVSGEVDIKSLRLGGSETNTIHPVHVFNGKVHGLLPTAALPVYVLGGAGLKGTSASNGASNETENDSKATNAELRKKYGVIGYLVKRLKRKLTKGKDFEKELNTAIGGMKSPQDKEALELAMTTELVEAQGGGGGNSSNEKKEAEPKIMDFLKDAFLGSKAGALLSAGIGSIATALFKSFIPFLGTFLAAKDGDYERVALNTAKYGARFLPGKKTVGELFKRIGNFGKGVADDVGGRIGKAGGFLSKAKAGYSLARETGMGRVKSLANVPKWMSQIPKGATASNVGEATKLVTKITDAIKKLLSNSKILKVIGGSKMLKSSAGLISSITAPLLKAGKGLLGKIVTKIAAWPVTVAAAVWDLTTGMAEANRILQIPKDSVTLKMRIVSGIVKMIDGLLFGLVPENELAQFVFSMVSDSDEDKKYQEAKTRMDNEYYSYLKKEGLTSDDFSFDDYNKKVNKSVAGKIWDTVSSPFKAVGNAVSNTVKGVKDFASGMISGNGFSAIGIYLKSILEALLGGNVDTQLVNYAGQLMSTDGLYSPGALSTYATMKKYAQGGEDRSKSRGNTSDRSRGSAATSSTTSKSSTGVNYSLLPDLPNLDTSFKNIKTPQSTGYNVDNVVYYNQNDPRWNTKNSPRLNFAEYGCGPTVAAMIISSYTGKPVTPTEMDQAATRSRYKNQVGATEISFFPFIARNYKLIIKKGIVTEAAIAEEVKQSKPVIIVGRAASNNDPTTPYNTTMHYMIISSYNSSTKTFHVIDPFAVATGNYSAAKVLRDTTNVLFTSDSQGKGVSSYKSKEASKKAYADTDNYDTELAPYNIGMDPEAGSEGNKSIFDLYGLVDSIGNFFSSMVSKKYGFDYDEESFNGLFGSTAPFNSPTVDVAGLYPMDSIVRPMINNPWLTGDTDVMGFFGNRLARLAQDQGQKININSGYRSNSEQWALWNKHIRDNPNMSDSDRRRWVAKPGSSRHELGIAADVGGWAKDLTNDQLAQYGLIKPLSNEAWHVEPLEIQGMPTSDLKSKYTAMSDTKYQADVAKQSNVYAYGMDQSNKTALFSKTNDINKTVGTLNKVMEQSKQIQAEMMHGTDSALVEKLTDLLNRQLDILTIIAQNTANPIAVAVPGDSKAVETVRSNNQSFINAIRK